MFGYLHTDTPLTETESKSRKMVAQKHFIRKLDMYFEGPADAIIVAFVLLYPIPIRRRTAVADCEVWEIDLKPFKGI